MKFIFLLLVYFAGFSTAIYFLAPPLESQEEQTSSNQTSTTEKSTNFNFDSQQFVKSFNAGIHKCIDFGKVAAKRTAKFLKEKAIEIQSEGENS